MNERELLFQNAIEIFTRLRDERVLFLDAENEATLLSEADFSLLAFDKELVIEGFFCQVGHKDKRVISVFIRDNIPIVDWSGFRRMDETTSAGEVVIEDPNLLETYIGAAILESREIDVEKMIRLFNIDPTDLLPYIERNHVIIEEIASAISKEKAEKKPPFLRNEQVATRELPQYLIQYISDWERSLGMVTGLIEGISRDIGWENIVGVDKPEGDWFTRGVAKTELNIF